MTHDACVRAGALYLPLVVALFAGLVRRPRPRQFAACLLGLLWAAVVLLLLQKINLCAGWWSFPIGGTRFCGMPVELYLGWTILWGVVPQLLFPRLRLLWVAGTMAALDLLAMPLCSAVVTLNASWLVGEAVALVLVLFPALAVARWTFDDTHLRARAAMQITISGLLFLFWVPEVAFALRPGRGWIPLLGMAPWARSLLLQAICLLALPGVAAVMEFIERGQGTPIPYDPPKRLVISGIYRYCANPMQMSCAAVMLAWAAALRNGWLVLAAVVSLIYSVGIAAWDEGADLQRRFGSPWRDYRDTVRAWRVNWHPYATQPAARIYIAHSCGPCSELRAWLERRRPLGLQIVDAETLVDGPIQRMRYDPADGSKPVDGVRAMGRALEHIHFGWALCGAALRLPGVWQFVQLLMDGSGLGPRTIACERKK